MEIVDRIMGYFHAPEPEPLPEPDAKLALAALMVRIAKADKSYAVEEISRIDKILQELFSLGPVDAAKMRATCEKLDAASAHEGRFAKLIRDSLNEDDRLKAVEALHSVMLADGIERPEEEDVLVETATILGIGQADIQALHGGRTT